ncbi:MAG: CHASE domain-containing protein, partial [Ilumatobacteraceae bacterium]
MATPDGTPDLGGRDRWGLPGAFGRWVTPSVVALVLVVGGGATTLLYRQADINSRNQRADLAMRASRALAATVGELEAGLSGANGLVDPATGDVDRARFAEFADRVVIATGMKTLGYEPLVDDGARASYELESGGPIKQADSTGTLVRAATRPTYAPVKWSLPALDTAASVKGFDILSDPARAAAATSAVEDGAAGFSSPVPVRPGGATAFFVVQPIYQVGARVGT